MIGWSANASLPLPSTPTGERREGLSIAFVSGVAFTLWSRTLAEGEAFGGRYTMIGGRLNVGATERSLGPIEFVASRSVGGGAAVTAGAGNEVGTIAGGTISVDVSGNDVRVRMVYTATGTLHWTDTIWYDAVDVPQS